MSVELPPDVAAFIGAARVARLATLTPEGDLHVVPVCPVLDRDRLLVATEPTRKVRNLQENPHVGLAFDDYAEDWSRLRGVSVSGIARVHDAGAVWDRGRDLLYGKFPQYPAEAEIVGGRTLMIEIEIGWVSPGGL